MSYHTCISAVYFSRPTVAGWCCCLILPDEWNEMKLNTMKHNEIRERKKKQMKWNKILKLKQNNMKRKEMEKIKLKGRKGKRR